MTPEEQLDEARAKEALREADEANRYFTFLEVATLAARRAREGWTPPKPVDLDILAFREWIETSPYREEEDDALCQTYLAGARMAREQEQQRAKVLVLYVEAEALKGNIRARAYIAKYNGEA